MTPHPIALPDPLRRDAAATSTRLATALRDPPPADTSGDRSPASPRWRGQSLSKGAVGVAVLHAARARSGLGPPETAHAWLAAATREPLSAGDGAGLWYGATAVAFGLRETFPDRHPQIQEELDAAVAHLVRTRLRTAHARIDAGTRPTLDEFDLVRGLTGLGAYLLHRDPADPLLRQVLDYLVRLTAPLPGRDAAGGHLPGWWSSQVPSGCNGPDAVGGHADLGMAHGICGPLALLALAARAGATADGHAQAIETITGWLETWRQDGPAGPWWPERVTPADIRAARTAQERARRPSWCYGTPGIARALHLAAIATGDHARQERAEEALARCLADPLQTARLTDPALCHGWAGVVATAWCACADARTGLVDAHLPRVLKALIDHAPAPTPPAHEPLGLIEGAAGVATVLHDAAAMRMGGWVTCLLIN